MNVLDLIRKTATPDTPGTAAALSRKLGVSQQTIQAWKRNGIPEVRQAWIRERWPEAFQSPPNGAGDELPPQRAMGA